MRILCVDDSKNGLYLQETIFRSFGYEVVAARNAIEALEILKQTPCDVIISDVIMPRMDGFQFCREVKKNKDTSHIPFIFYSGTYNDKKDEVFALSLGVARIIPKPSDPDKLAATVQEVIREHSGKQQPAVPPALAPPVGNDQLFLKTYNDLLVRKLEEKVEQLDTMTRELQKALVQKERDFETLQQSERASAEALAGLKEIFDHGADAMFVFNVEAENAFTFLVVNPAFERVFGATRKALIGMKPEELFPADVAESLTAHARLCSKPGACACASFILEFEAQSGKHVLHIQMTPVPDAQGRIFRIAGIGRDLETLRKLDASKAQMDLHALHAQKMEALFRLAGGVAHDFNNMLTIIIGRSQHAQKDLAEGNAQKREFDLIGKTGKRAAMLTKKLTAFSRQQNLAPKGVNLNEVIRNNEKTLRKQLGDQIKFELTMDPELMRVKADPEQIELALMYLFTNARDALLDEGMVRVRTANVFLDQDLPLSGLAKPLRAGSYARLSVHDSAKPLSDSEKYRVFEPFFLKKEFGRGNGLDLPAVFGIVEQSGGVIEVLSDAQGTTYRIYLQAAPVEAPEIKTVPVDTTYTKGKETILVVEDETDLGEYLTEELDRLGYRAIYCRHPGEALEASERHTGPIHLLLSDVVMPIMNGVELYERLNRMRPGIKVLFMSGYMDAIPDNKNLPSTTAFIPKPFNFPEIQQKVREVLEGK